MHTHASDSKVRYTGRPNVKTKTTKTNIRTTAHIHRSDNMEDSALPPVNDSSQAAFGTESASGSDCPACPAPYGAWGAPLRLGYELGC